MAAAYLGEVRPFASLAISSVAVVPGERRYPRDPAAIEPGTGV